MKRMMATAVTFGICCAIIACSSDKETEDASDVAQTTSQAQPVFPHQMMQGTKPNYFPQPATFTQLTANVLDTLRTMKKLYRITRDEYWRNRGGRAQAASLGLGDVVQFAGFRDDLDEFIGCFDLFVHPALTEGLGVATLKAQAAGVAVIGFAAGGLSEAIEHEKTGLLVPPEDVEMLQDAIAILVNDDVLRHRLGRAGQKRMQNEFSIATMADRHIEVYESVLNG